MNSTPTGLRAASPTRAPRRLAQTNASGSQRAYNNLNAETLVNQYWKTLAVSTKEKVLAIQLSKWPSEGKILGD